MPSKRKKNKRRMRRVQAQRRAFEDQHAANPPIKTGPGIAASTAPAAPKKAAKTEKNIPKAVPVVAPVVQIPQLEPELIVKEPEPVPVQVAAAEPEVLDRAPAEVKAEPRADAELGAPSDFEVEARAGVTEEPPVEWTPAVEPSTGQVGVLQEVIVPQTEPAPEVKPPDEAPAVTETQTVEAVLTETEAEQSYGVCEPETEQEAETFVEETMEVRVQLEEDVTDFSVADPGQEASKEPAAEDFSSGHVSAEAEADSITEAPKPERPPESISPAAAAQEGEQNVLVEEDKAAVCAEPVTTAEDAAVQPLEIHSTRNTVTGTILEALEEEAEAREEVAEFLVDVVSESASGVEDVITASAFLQQEIMTTSDNLRTLTESRTGTPAEPEAAAAPAESALASAAADQMCLNASTEEPKSDVCDVPCQTQLPVEPVQHDSVEISVETTLNGHMVPEVSIEDAPWSF